MRRKLVKWGAVVCIVAALLAFLRWKMPAKQDVSLAETSLEAAEDLEASYQAGQNSLMFHSKDISELEVYHLLQAGEPYLSNLETATYQSGAVKLTWNIPQKQEQDDGLAAARKLGAEAVEGQTTITGKLQAIHDMLIRNCVCTQRTASSVPRWQQEPCRTNRLCARAMRGHLRPCAMARGWMSIISRTMT